MSSSMVSRAVFEAVKRSGEVVAIDRDDCRGCGECCSQFIPLASFEVPVIRNYVEKHGLKPKFQPIKCPFLTESSECMIYEVRPIICKCYDCRSHKDGLLFSNPQLWSLRGVAVADLAELFCDKAEIDAWAEKLMGVAK